jgi:hypothetical protein
VNEEASKLFPLHPYPDFIACQNWKRENGVNERGHDNQSARRSTMTTLSNDCRASLYRIVWESADGSVQAFALESTREAARRFLEAAIALISGRSADELELYNLYSYRDLIDNGISEDEDLRVFEVDWRGEVVTAWTDKPLFLTTDPTLVSKWAELQADLAAQVVRDAIGRAGGQR